MSHSERESGEINFRKTNKLSFIFSFNKILLLDHHHCCSVAVGQTFDSHHVLEQGDQVWLFSNDFVNKFSCKVPEIYLRLFGLIRKYFLCKYKQTRLHFGLLLENLG